MRVAAINRQQRQDARDERNSAAWLRLNGCAPACLNCAIGIHDVESGVCPCCHQDVE